MISTKHFITQHNGFTLIEIMVSLIILSILLLIGIPLFNQMLSNKRVSYAAESFHNDLKFAQSEALKKQTTVYVSVKTGASWCYGLDDNSDCDCSVINSCLFNGVEYVKNASAYNITDLSSTSLPVGLFTNNIISIDGVRGTFSGSGDIHFNLAGSDFARSITVEIERNGRSSVCSSTVNGYSAC